MTESGTLRIGTRGSPLALAQARKVMARLAAAHADLARSGAVEIVTIVTSGDRIQDRSLAELGGKGLFTKEIDLALLAGEVDLAVHSLKDLPTLLPEALILACVPEREDPRDALLSPKARRIGELPQGARVGTSSLRRAAQLLNRRPDLKIVPLRGNVGTRLEKLARGEAEATILALAGLRRLDAAAGAHPIPAEEMLPAVGQGALAITCRANDLPTRDRLAALDDAAIHDAVHAERAFLAALDGSCKTPIAALARVSDGALALRGLVATPDGRELHEISREGWRADAGAIGRAAGEALLARCGPRFFDFKG